MKSIEEIRSYAKKNDVPIMKDAGMNFICTYIKDNNVKNVLEIGSAIGYSAIQFALAAEDVNVTTIEIDIDRFSRAVDNINSLELSDRIQIFNADALTFDIDENCRNKKFDLIFIDAAKAQYIKFFEKYKHNLCEDGAIISDNLSFHGMVEGYLETQNYSTIKLLRKIKKYVSFLKCNPEFDTTFYKTGDGISVSRKSSLHGNYAINFQQVPEPDKQLMQIFSMTEIEFNELLHRRTKFYAVSDENKISVAFSFVVEDNKLFINNFYFSESLESKAAGERNYIAKNTVFFIRSQGIKYNVPIMLPTENSMAYKDFFLNYGFTAAEKSELIEFRL